MRLLKLISLWAILIMTFVTSAISAKTEKVHATFENPCNTNTTWNSETKTFTWSTIYYNQLHNIGLKLGDGKGPYDISKYKKLVVDCKMVTGTQFRILFYNGGSNLTFYAKDGVNDYIIKDELEKVAPNDYNEYLLACDEICLSGDNYTAPGKVIINDIYLETFPDDGDDEEIYLEEWQLLKNAYSAMGEGNGWKTPWDFSDPNPSVRVLPGVKVENGHVKAITLTDNNLTGTFPVLLLSLPYLEELNLSNNALSGDIGMIMATYTYLNPSLQIPLKTINISGNHFSGNIGLFAKYFANLKSLNASNNCLTDVFPMISPNVTSLDLSRQETNRVVEVNLSDTSKAWLTQVPTILAYNHQQQTYGSIADACIFCSTKNMDWGFMVIYGLIGLPEQKEYYGESGDTLRVIVLDDIFTLQGSSFFIKLIFDKGDSNFDGQVNVLDLQSSINYIMEIEQNNLFNYTAANLWKDEVINVQDIISLVNLLMVTNHIDTEQTANARRVNSLGDATLYIQDSQLMLDTDKPVAAFDITIKGTNTINVARTLDLIGMTVNMKTLADGIHMIGYSLNGACIPAGISVIGTLDKTAHVRNAMLSDQSAHSISVSYDGNTTGIDNIDFSNHDNHNSYDLQGRRINNMSPKGIYIKNGHKMTK